MSRQEWDRAYLKIVEEQEEEDECQLITSAIITGRLSCILAAERAFMDGMDFDQFIQVMQYIVAQEIKTGKVDATTFEIPENPLDADDGKPGV